MSSGPLVRRTFGHSDPLGVNGDNKEGKHKRRFQIRELTQRIMTALRKRVGLAESRKNRNDSRTWPRCGAATGQHVALQPRCGQPG